jgi:hypothetical protein
MTSSEYKNKPSLQDYFNEAKSSQNSFSANDIQQAIHGSAKYQHSFWKSAGIKAGLAVTALAAIIAVVYYNSKPKQADTGKGLTTALKAISRDEIKASPEVNTIPFSKPAIVNKSKLSSPTSFDAVPPSGTRPVQPAVDSVAIDLKKIHPLILDKATLARLDISINPATGVCRDAGPIIICYEKFGTAFARSQLSDSVFRLQFTNHDSVRVEAWKYKGSYIAESMVTDDLGKAVRSYTTADDGHTPLQNDINTLIPILVRTGQDYTEEDERMHHWRPDVIFWFAPTQQFLNVLPDSIRNTLAAEYKYITATPEQKEKLSAGNCEYFEQCRATLNNISALNVYPNPTERELHVDFFSDKEQSIAIEITNLAGQHVAQLMPMKMISKGMNDLKFDLPHMPGGMYLLVITSADGKVATERLVRK